MMMVRVEGTWELTPIELQQHALSPAHIVQISNGEDDMEASQIIISTRATSLQK